MTAWAFVVGINAYPALSGLSTLKGAVADAAEFAEWALHPDGGGVSPQNLFFWSCPAPVNPPPRMADFLRNPTTWPQVRPDFGQAPGTQEICKGIYLVAAEALKAKAQRLYVFLAGHGVQTRQKSFQEASQTCFVTGDYDPRMEADGLVPCDDMARMLKVVGPPEIALFIDACRNNTSLRVARPRAPWNELTDPGHHLRICTGRAAQEQKLAYEIPHGNPTRGAFSTLLVNALSTHRVDGRLTVRDLESFVEESIPQLVDPCEQYPDIDEHPRPRKMVLAEGAPLVAPPEFVLTISTPRDGGLVLIGGPGNREYQLGADVGTQRFPLAPGAYVLETLGGTTLRTFSHLGPETTHVQL